MLYHFHQRLAKAVSRRIFGNGVILLTRVNLRQMSQGNNLPVSAQMDALPEFSSKEEKNKAKNDAKRAAKLAKLKAKQEKVGDLGAKAKSNVVKQAFAKKEESQVFVNKTPKGHKKDMSEPMSSSFNPRAVESSWYSWWEAKGLFSPECHEGKINPERETFTIVMPPPNVTGSLHLGHATMLSIEDAIVRWNRMQGKQVLFLPGCDHAGIATQAVVEKKLQRERQITRHDLGRQEFVKEVWKWKDQYGHKIFDQIKRMGASADWSRAAFTLDPALDKAVKVAFIQMFNEGLITRANRLVNWCGKLKTSLSDLEVDNLEIEGGQMMAAHGHDPKKKYKFGMMTHFSYKMEDDPTKEIVIATTRPETVFADSAVCVNPSDERYFEFHGKRLIHPVTGKSLPVIIDEAAEKEFGTGALKISPAHDPTDFEVGKRHSLPFIVIYDARNILNENCGKFCGMARYDAREAVIEHCRANGTLVDEQPHPMTIPVCSRSGDFVEPRLIPQWWLNCKKMAKDAVDAVKCGEIEITPKEHEKIWFNWLDNIRDWCLSRQLWWGHRIPAYKVKIEGVITGSDEAQWIAANDEVEALELAKAKNPSVDSNLISVSQDEDVLDTWFSSGLWPFSTVGWPKTDESNSDYSNFYPNNLMETGSDILFFWVARMVMLGKHLTGKWPFPKIFLHAIVRDAHGRKMSKSLGNVIDPIDVIEGISLEGLQARLDQGNLDPTEIKKAKAGQKKDFPNGIPQCGTDALRMALCSYVSEGRDVNLDIGRVEGYRKFCNKMWNATKFALSKLGDGYVPPTSRKEKALSGNESIVDLWILSKLGKTIREVNTAFAKNNLMIVTQSIYSFWLNDFCDVYIEAVKPLINSQDATDGNSSASKNVLYICLEEALIMLHPIMPFVTEELYQRLPRRPSCPYESISICPYPNNNDVSVMFTHPKAENKFNEIFDIVKNVRSIAAEDSIRKGSTVKLHGNISDTLRELESSIKSLVKAVGTLDISGVDKVHGKDAKPVCASNDLFVSFHHENTN